MVELTENEIRNLRDKAIWVRYDSVLVGPPGFNIDNTPGWFESFSAFSNTDEIRFNDGSRTEGTAGATYCNQSGDSEDFAQKIYQTKVEFFCTFGNEQVDVQGLDSAQMPFMWTHELPERCNFRVKVADVDGVLKVPGVMLPSTMGAEASAIGGAAGTIALPGHTGQAALTVGWVWPEPLEIPAKGKLVTILRLGFPIKQFLQALVASPGIKNIPIPIGNNIDQLQAYPNTYGIRVSHWGPRFVQLRGARSS